MSHEHDVIDVNEALVIDAINKTITNPTGDKIVLAQYDHNSQRITCKIPRYIDEHDMYYCDAVEIHYDNVSSGTSVSTRSINSGVYDAKPSLIEIEGDPDHLLCTWLISQNATQYAGIVKFKLKFICHDDENVAEYIWNTDPSTDIIEVHGGFDNADTIVEQYADIIEQWRQSLIDTILRYKGQITYSEFITLAYEEAGDMYIVSREAGSGVPAGSYRLMICAAPRTQYADSRWIGFYNTEWINSLFEGVRGDIASLSGRTEELETKVDGLDTRVGVNKELIGNLSIAATLDRGDIDRLSETTETLQTRVSTNETNISDLTGRTETLEGNTSDLANRTDTLEDQMVTASGRLHDHGEGISRLTGRIDSAESAISTNASGITELAARMDAMQVDSEVTDNSRNPVSGNAVYDFVTDKVGTIPFRHKGAVLSFKYLPTQDIRSGDVYWAMKEQRFYMWDADVTIDGVKGVWLPFDSPSSGVTNLTDTVTGESYELSVANGKLTLTKIGG